MEDIHVDQYFKNLRYRLELFRLIKEEMGFKLASDFKVCGQLTIREDSLSDIPFTQLSANGTHGQRGNFPAFIIFTLFAFGFSLAAAQTVLHGKVVRVSDGDSFTLLDSTNTQVRIRLHGIDAPESNQAFGTKAKDYLGELIHEKQVPVEVTDIDQYGRTIGVVSLDGVNVNQEMLRAGFAWWYRTYAKNDTILERLENEAREGKIGLWADAHPIAPWDFRKGVSISTGKKKKRAEAATAESRLKQACCKNCKKGKACGDTCIPRIRECQVLVGCACNE